MLAIVFRLGFSVSPADALANCCDDKHLDERYSHFSNNGFRFCHVKCHIRYTCKYGEVSVASKYESSIENGTLVENKHVKWWKAGLTAIKSAEAV